MCAQLSCECSPPAQAIGALLDDLSGVAAVLAAGGRARAVADACQACGLAAILLDASGRVLHVSPLAATLLGTELRIESSHVLGQSPFANEAVESVLNPILGEGAPRVRTAAGLIVADVPCDEGLVVGALAYEDELPGQLLKAILLIGTGAEDMQRRVLDFRRLEIENVLCLNCADGRL